MKIRYDEKGKFFTDVISKNPVPITVQSLTHRIHGQMHVRPDERVKDELNRNNNFIALTDAVIYSGNGEELFRSNFIALNVSQIVWVLPDDDAVDKSEGK